MKDPGKNTLLKMWKYKFRNRFRHPCRQPAVALIVNGMSEGGVEQVILDLYHGYQKRGYRAYIVCQNWIIESVKAKLDRPEDLFVFEGDLIALIHFLWRRDIRNLHYHYNIFGMEELKMLGLCIIYTMHNTYTWMSDDTIQAYAKHLSCADHVVAVSESVKEYFCNRTGNCSIPFTVINNGVDFSILDVEGNTLPYSRESLGIHDGEIVIGFVGSFYHAKSQIGMLGVTEKLIAKYPQVKVVFLGNKGDINYYTRFKNELINSEAKDHIVLAEPISHSQMGDFYRKIIDIFTLPTLHEGNPLVAIEAMYCGCPMVLTPSGISGELAQKAACLVCDAAYESLEKVTDDEIKNHLSLEKHAKNENSVVSCLSAIIDELPMYRNRADQCRKNALDYSVENMTDAYIRLLEPSH